ncbi:PucR family transcriptional regulator [Rhodococcus sp. AW25M09]|uniref:PucR family transcriptional regulator n=1 Tax=Rhodococcus sp. AW25M09 TaxID=1268303 RepID=UPI00034DCB48|nr:helix-turn-helix domain-containing protein [Rhodococcus sp. AW25M09]
MTDFDPTSWIGELAANLVKPSDVAAVIERLNDEIAAELPLFDTDLELRRDLDASTAGQLRAFVAYLLADADVVRPAVEAVHLARTIARRGMDLSVLLRIYRHGQQSALRYTNEMVESQDAPEDGRVEILIELWSRASAWFGLCVEQLITAYTEERERWLRSALTRRRQQVEAVLRGDAVDVTAAETSLGHPLRRHHTALVIVADSETDGTTRLEEVAARLAVVLSVPRPLLLPVGSRTLWAWLATDHIPDLTLLNATTLPSDIRIGIGITANGIDGFRSSHREAVAALRVDTRQLALYADVELLSLLSADPTALSTFIDRTLGQLADDIHAALRDTVIAYLAAGVGGASTSLGLHRNTVRYRIRQAEELLGRTVETGNLELHLALVCAAASTQRPN